MSEPLTGWTRGGTAWTPAFVIALDHGKCIGCGRCFKVCPRDVFELVEADELDLHDVDDDDDGYDDDDNSMVMSLSDPLDCIGCQACAKVCPKKCLSHAPQNVSVGLEASG